MIYNRVGEKHVNMQGCGMEIIFYISAKDCTIRFDDGTIIEHVRYEHIKNKQIRNLNLLYDTCDCGGKKRVTSKNCKDCYACQGDKNEF